MEGLANRSKFFGIRLEPYIVKRVLLYLQSQLAPVLFRVRDRGLIAMPGASVVKSDRLADHRSHLKCAHGSVTSNTIIRQVVAKRYCNYTKMIQLAYLPGQRHKVG